MRKMDIEQAQDCLDLLVESDDPVLVTSKGAPTSVMLPYDLYRVMRAEIELLRSERREEVLEAHERVKRGDTADMQVLELEATA